MKIGRWLLEEERNNNNKERDVKATAKCRNGRARRQYSPETGSLVNVLRPSSFRMGWKLYLSLASLGIDLMEHSHPTREGHSISHLISQKQGYYGPSSGQ